MGNSKNALNFFEKHCVWLRGGRGQRGERADWMRVFRGQVEVVSSPAVHIFHMDLCMRTPHTDLNNSKHLEDNLLQQSVESTRKGGAMEWIGPNTDTDCWAHMHN